MAGYLFSLNSQDSLQFCIYNGVYSTILTNPVPGSWRAHQEGTFADYTTMKEGDNVYFFIKRKIYGIGSLVNIDDDCKFLNYPSSNEPRTFNYEDVANQLLIDTGPDSTKNRFVCLFKPDPAFFKTGIDMDDILNSNPAKFKILRAFWKLSFIKFGDDENQAFRDMFLKCHQESLSPLPNENTFLDNHVNFHALIDGKLSAGEYHLDVSPLIESCADGEKIKHEMAIEAGILSQLSSNDSHTISILGKWDYLSHQVIASPFKAIDYMDKMDIFGYSFIADYPPTISKYLIIEIKKGTANKDDVLQLMKYVDWVKSEYCYGDYSMINAFLIANNFTLTSRNTEPLVERKYIVGVRPARSSKWKNLKLVKYSYNQDTKKILLSIVEDMP